MTNPRKRMLTAVLAATTVFSVAACDEDTSPVPGQVDEDSSIDPAPGPSGTDDDDDTDDPDDDSTDDPDDDSTDDPDDG